MQPRGLPVVILGGSSVSSQSEPLCESPSRSHTWLRQINFNSDARPFARRLPTNSLEAKQTQRRSQESFRSNKDFANRCFCAIFFFMSTVQEIEAAIPR